MLKKIRSTLSMLKECVAMSLSNIAGNRMRSFLTVLGILIGLPVGVWLLNVLLHKLASEYELQLSVSPLSFVVTVALTLGVSLLVSLMVARKNKKIDMVEALKGAE